MKFIETIKIEHADIELFELHQLRMQQTAQAHRFDFKPLSKESLLSSNPISFGRVKCRVEYSEKGVVSVDYSSYQVREIRSLKVVENESVEYDFKYADRSILDELRALRGECDDVIIVKNGLVTDCSYANIVFEKNGEFFTPNSFLLNGVRRLQLLATGRIKECVIRSCDIKTYDSVLLINGMIDLGEVVIRSSAIHL